MGESQMVSMGRATVVPNRQHPPTGSNTELPGNRSRECPVHRMELTYLVGDRQQ